MNLIELIRHLGLSEKASELYLASLELGEATLQDIAKRAGVKRTSAYYVFDELIEFGALVSVKRNRKQYYIAEEPRALLKRSRERIAEVEESIEELESRKHAVFKRPRVLFFYGPAGFKQVWERVFATPEKQFLIITGAENFIDFVREKYITDEIIKMKKKLGVRSRQLIVDSPEAHKIISKDREENRESKLLPSRYPLPFTEIVCEDFVAFISPRPDNLIMIIENKAFARTRRSLFEDMWNMVGE